MGLMHDTSRDRIRYGFKKAAAAIAFLVASVCLFVPFLSMAAITVNPQTAAFPEYSVAYYTCEADDEGAEYHWYVIYDGTTYDFNDPDLTSKAVWVNYVESGLGVSPDGKSLHFDGVRKEMNGAFVYCVVKAGDKEYVSTEAAVTVTDEGSQMPPVVSVNAPVTISLGESVKLSCKVDAQEGTSYTYQWYRTSSGKIFDIMAFLDEGSDKAEFTVTPDSCGTYYYCCMATATGAKGSASTYSGMIEVTVTEAATESPTDDPAKETEGPSDTGASAEPSETEGSEATAAPATAKPSSANGGLNVMSLLVVIFAVLCVLVCIAVVIVIIILLSKKKK
ncbi:MAG: immunoglobulin domain-containing protein [Clostridia bacterium]|nr:immunoglobulin domain-containing protein [Clostridia bacterium]